VCWLGGSNPTDKPSNKAIASVKWLYEQVGGELKPHSSFKQTQCPGDAWRQWIIEEKSPTISNASPPDVHIPNSFEKKLDDILTKLESIERKLKLGKLIQ
jgi:hypothetical protein